MLSWWIVIVICFICLCFCFIDITKRTETFICTVILHLTATECLWGRFYEINRFPGSWNQIIEKNVSFISVKLAHFLCVFLTFRKLFVYQLVPHTDEIRQLVTAILGDIRQHSQLPDRGIRQDILKLSNSPGWVRRRRSLGINTDRCIICPFKRSAAKCLFKLLTWLDALIKRICW